MMFSDVLAANLQPLSEMPIWGRLQFADMIPATYFYDEDCFYPRFATEARVQGFTRREDCLWVFFTLKWDDEIDTYLWCAEKGAARKPIPDLHLEMPDNE